MRVVDRMSREQAEFFVARGTLDPEFDRVTGQQIGYRIAGGARDPLDSDLSSVHLAIEMDLAQMEMNLEAKYARGSLLGRIYRAAEAIPEKSIVERVEAKVYVYKHVGPERGAILAGDEAVVTAREIDFGLSIN